MPHSTPFHQTHLRHEELHENVLSEGQAYPVMGGMTQMLNSMEEQDLFPNMSIPDSRVDLNPRPVHELRIESFPVWYFSSIDASTSEIANLLEILIKDYHERTETDSLLIPSIIELSLYFQCPEVQIIDAFEYLKRKQHYELSYETAYAKVYVSRLNAPQRQIAMQASDDGIDWRDITHDFYTDVVQPVQKKLAGFFL